MLTSLVSRQIDSKQPIDEGKTGVSLQQGLRLQPIPFLLLISRHPIYDEGFWGKQSIGTEERNLGVEKVLRLGLCFPVC